jgi:hypothetical protein
MSNGGADDESSSAHFAMESRSVSSQAMGRVLPLIFATAAIDTPGCWQTGGARVVGASPTSLC